MTEETDLTMLRNHLIALLSEKDNDTVTVDLSGILIDIEAVTGDRGCIVLNLNLEDVEEVVHRMASRTPTDHTTNDVRAPSGAVTGGSPVPTTTAASRRWADATATPPDRYVSRPGECVAGRAGGARYSPIRPTPTPARTIAGTSAGLSTE